MSLTVITGPMFSGKSEELVRRVKKYKYKTNKICYLKPEIDNRSTGNHTNGIYTHAGNWLDLDTYLINGNSKCRLLVPEDTDLIVIDEVQFFNTTILDDINYWLLKNKTIIAAGLDLDSEGKPFGLMPSLLCQAFDVVKLTAVCLTCKKEATRTRRKVRVASQILIGGSKEYEPLCFTCWTSSF